MSLSGSESPTDRLLARGAHRDGAEAYDDPTQPGRLAGGQPPCRWEEWTKAYGAHGPAHPPSPALSDSISECRAFQGEPPVPTAERGACLATPAKGRCSQTTLTTPKHMGCNPMNASCSITGPGARKTRPPSCFPNMAPLPKRNRQT